MNTNTPDRPPLLPLSDSAKEALQRTLDSAKAATQTAGTAIKASADDAMDATKNCCNSLSAKVESGVVRAQEEMRQNPMAVVLGAVAFGVAVGCLIAFARRDVPTLRERFVDDPVQTTRDTLYAALAPVAQRLHDGAGSAMNGLHRTSDSWANQLGRVGSNLKFW